MALAWRCRRRLAGELSCTDEAWPFEDRVLVWLAEHWRDDVARYHRDAGHDMAKRFEPHQLAHIDEHYREKLRGRLKGIV